MLKLLVPILMLASAPAEAAFVITGRGGMIPIPSSPSRHNRPSEWNMQCENRNDVGEWYLACRYYTPGQPKRDGVAPIFHCSFTVYSHVQRGHCTDGNGGWPSKLRGSGPHPRDKDLRN